MDDPESWPQPSGLTAEGAKDFAAAYSCSASKEDDWWAKAEDQTAKFITSIQPIQPSEERRQAVNVFVRRLIQTCFDCEVVTFGSVPLKTYLPDGDIDLTALSFSTELKETWAQEVHKILQKAEQNAEAEFRVREVQMIHAEVKIIKCLVENIVVDISFNQIGGLSTLCFLEEVDKKIGQNHLFKRSIILVKAWCYYESRILGANHGLISTYALETLVLYIFHVFHSSLRGPLEVLFTFLEYFSNFDWEKYCVSLWGPVPLQRLNDTAAVDAAESPRKDGGSLLLTKDFLEECIEKYSGVAAGQDSNQGRSFDSKYLNVLDPIRVTNNLGRRVNKGNFSRIRMAFGLGARTLGGVLKCSKDNISTEFKQFFASTFKNLDRYHSGGRPDTATPSSRGPQKPITGGSVAQKERSSSGYRQEHGDSIRYSQVEENYLAEAARTQYVSRHEHFHSPRPQGGIDPPERASYMIGNHIDPTLWTREPLYYNGRVGAMTSVTLPLGIGRDSGNSTTPGVPNSDSKQDLSRGVEPGILGSASGSLNVAGSEGQWRQDGKGGFISSEGESLRVQNRGSMHETSQGASEKPITLNRRSSDSCEQTQPGESSQDSLRWGCASEDPAGKGVSLSRDSTGPNINPTNYMGGPPGFSGEVTSSNSGNSHGRNSTDDGMEMSTSGRKSGSSSVSEEDKNTHSNWIGNQSEYIPSIDSSYQVVGLDQGSQSMVQMLHPLMQAASYMPILPYGHPGQVHLAPSMPGSSSMPIPSLSLSGPPPAPPSLQSTHPSSLGESGVGLGSRTKSFMAMRGPMPPPLPPSPYSNPAAYLGDGSGSHMTAFPASHGKEQRDYWRPALEEQMQPQLRPSATTSAAPGGHSLQPLQIPDRHFSLGSASVSAGSPSLIYLPPPMLHQIGAGQLKSSPGELAADIRADLKPAAQSSIDDSRKMDESNLLQEGSESVESSSGSRDTNQCGADMKIAVGKPSKASKEKWVPGRMKSGIDGDATEVVRGGDGNPAENSVQWHGQQSTNETQVPGMQAVPQHVPVSTSAPFLYFNLVAPSLSHPQSSSVVSSPSPTAQSQLPLPASVSVPMSQSSSFRSPISEFASMSVGSSQRYRPMENAPLTPPTYYAPFFPIHPGYPGYYLVPTSTDGVDRVDSMGALYFNGSMDAGTNSLGSQVVDDLRGRGSLQVGSVMSERLKAAGPATTSCSRIESTNVERVSEGEEPNDILSGNVDHHKYQLWRFCQNPLLASPNPSPSAKYSQLPRLWEGSVRPSGNLNPHMGYTLSHSLGVPASSMHSPGRMASGNYQPRGFTGYGNEETSPKPRGGTGTYLPNLKYNRERQAPGGGRGGSQHGAYGQDRSERVNDRTNEREGAHQAQGHGSRYRGVGQGRGQQSKHESRAQASIFGAVMNDQKSSAPDRERNNTRLQAMERRVPLQAPLGSVPSPTNPIMPAGPYHIKSNGKPWMNPSPIAAPVLVYPANDRSMVYSPDQSPIEFGSVGQVPFGASQVGGQMSGGRASHEQVYVSGPPGSSGLSSPRGERSQHPSSPQQRSMQRVYQMHEEDFPPLSFRGQHATSSAGLNSSIQGPHYRAYVTVSPSS